MEKIINTLTPALTTRMLTSEQREAFEKGLTLLEGTPKAQAFVRESRRFKTITAVCVSCSPTCKRSTPPMRNSRKSVA